MKEAVNGGDLSPRNSGALQWFACEALGATYHGQSDSNSDPKSVSFGRNCFPAALGDHDSRRRIASLGCAGDVF